MTGLDASASLFKFFASNDFFETGQHFKDVILISENRDLEEACLDIGLNELSELGVISKVTKKNKDYWILKKPLAHYDQKVDLSAGTALTVAQVLNEICDNIGNTEDKCDPLSINEGDINNLVTIASKFFEKSD